MAQSDAAAILAMNDTAIPAVSPITSDLFSFFVERAEQFVAIADGEVVAGFLILLGADVEGYGSENYAWFSDRYDDFLYVDRIVIDPDHRGAGLGRRLYEQTFAWAAARPVLAEVNTRPRNAESLAFHEAMGFTQVGAQQTEGGTKEVAMLCRPPLPS